MQKAYALGIYNQNIKTKINNQLTILEIRKRALLLLSA